MTGPIVSVEIGRSTWQGPAEEAPASAGERDGRASGQQVRALEWKKEAPGIWLAGPYSVRDDHEGYDVNFCDLNLAFVGHNSCLAPLERAQSIAEDHHRAYILAALTPAPQPKDLSQAARDVLAERQRQVTAEGWTPGHDDQHAEGELAAAATAYAFNAATAGRYYAHDPIWFWPWGDGSWKPTTPRRDLVKAGALILAEIERLDRAETRARSEGKV